MMRAAALAAWFSVVLLALNAFGSALAVFEDGGRATHGQRIATGQRITPAAAPGSINMLRMTICPPLRS